ncbi:MAG: hypothetical protein U9P07_12580 [Pseudomonadota bacterium]|nr:hypothetical protein [Pseudomonadota bacterium]
MALAHSRRPSMAGSKASAERITSCDSFGGQYRYEPDPYIQVDRSTRVK